MWAPPELEPRRRGPRPPRLVRRRPRLRPDRPTRRDRVPPGGLGPGNPGDGDRATEPVAWSADGRFVAYNGIYGAAATGSLNVVEVATGRVVAQRSPDGFSETVAPAWAPAGARLAVIANGLRDGRQVMFVYEVGPEGAEGRRGRARRPPRPPEERGPARVEPGRAPARGRGQRGRVLRDIDVVDAATGAVVGVGPGRRPAWSPDGRRLAFDDSGGRLLVYDVERHTTKPVPTAGTLWYESLGWSGDGRHVLALTNDGPTPTPGETPTFVDVETGARVVALAARVHSADYLTGSAPIRAVTPSHGSFNAEAAV